MSFTKFIPSDAPKHDDRNELFNDPAKLEDKSFSIMVASSSCQTQLRGSDFCTRWIGLNLCAGRSIASYIPCGVSLRPHISFGSSTSSCLRQPCFGLLVMICQCVVCFCFKGVHSSCPVLVFLWQQGLLQPRLVLFRI